MLKLSSIRSWPTMAKLLSWPGRRPRLVRSAAVTWSCASCTVAVSVGRTAISSQSFQYSVDLGEGRVRDGQPRLVGVAEERRRLDVHARPLRTADREILIRLPIGSRPGKSDSASLSLMTTTRAPAAYSIWVKLRPARMSPPFTRFQLGLIPAMSTLLSSTPSKLTGPLVYSPMLTSRTAGSWRMSSASSTVRRASDARATSRPSRRRPPGRRRSSARRRTSWGRRTRGCR